MISTIITIALAGYLGIFYGGFLIGFMVDIASGNWKDLWKGFGAFMWFNSIVLIGAVVVLFTVGNIFNWFVGWKLHGLANPNVLGFIVLGVCISLNMMGKTIMGKAMVEELKK